MEKLKFFSEKNAVNKQLFSNSDVIIKLDCDVTGVARNLCLGLFSHPTHITIHAYINQTSKNKCPNIFQFQL